jgi:hypothetical protein
MATRNIGIVIEGATGRLGTTQHLRALMAIRSEGGLVLANGDRLVPEPVLLGRNPAKLAVLAAANGDLKWGTDLWPTPVSQSILTRTPPGVGPRVRVQRYRRGNTSISKNRSPKPSMMH